MDAFREEFNTNYKAISSELAQGLASVGAGGQRNWDESGVKREVDRIVQAYIRLWIEITKETGEKLEPNYD